MEPAPPPPPPPPPPPAKSRPTSVKQQLVNNLRENQKCQPRKDISDILEPIRKE